MVCLINSLRFVKFVHSLVVKGALRLLLLFFWGGGGGGGIINVDLGRK